MKNQYKLFMIMLGCRPQGRFTEQHDVFFGIAEKWPDLTNNIQSFWPEAKGQIHIDVWREVTHVDNYRIEVVPKGSKNTSENQLFFLNLGGYRPGEFDEYHYKMLTVAPSLAEAIKKAKAATFYKQFSFKGAVSHVDDKFGVDVDDAFRVEEILSTVFTEKFELNITPSESPEEDQLHIGYLKLDKIK